MYDKKKEVFLKRLFLIFILPIVLFAKMGYINVAGGVFDISGNKHQTKELSLEYQIATSWGWLHPIFGVLQTFKGATYLSCGLALNVQMKRFLLIPSISAGYYHQGSGKDLGCPLEFRSTLMVGFQTKNQIRIGLQIAHMSNAHLGNKNPGEESLDLVISIPLKSLSLSKRICQ